MPDSVRIRAASPGDASAIAAIYAPHVLTGVASFEVESPDAEEILRRISAVTALGLPYLVAEIDGDVAGYAYASQFRSRAAYRFTAENSVYVAGYFQRRGVARSLMQALISQSADAGVRQMIAVIADPAASKASVALHRSLGFDEVGVLRAVGDKFGHALDVLLMQRSLLRAGAPAR